MADWRDRRVPEFQTYLRGVLGREPTERDYAAAIMQLEQRGQGSVAVGHAFKNRIEAEGGDPAKHLRHYDPVALGHRWREVTPQAIDKWGAEYDRIGTGAGPLQPGQTHFFSPAGMQSYYNKDPSLVRSAVRMNVPGQGEVLVPNWATKAVAAGDYTNVNGEWFLTPNERYGRDVPVRERSQDAEAQPGGFYGQPIPPAETAVASASPSGAGGGGSAAKPSWSDNLASFGKSAEAALRLAKPRQQEGDGLDPIQFVTPAQLRPVKMAEAPVPYLTRAEGGGVGIHGDQPDQALMRAARADGHMEPRDGGAGRFASPMPLVTTPTKSNRFVDNMMERIIGVHRMPFAEGGAIDDTGSNAPEDVNALRAQQRQLIEGRRSAQMFPRGTEELPLPPFMERIETARGVYHFDPMKVSADEIVEASRTGRENDILGLWPLSKNDVAKLVGETGESPVAITERDQAGNEVKASMATQSTVAMQSDDILRSAAPGHKVDVKPVEDVVMARGIGGSVHEYARGGGIGGGGAIVGALTGATGGRADKIPGTARAGSHVLPADVVSHLGQGNSMAGLRTLQQMFKTGPYGTPLATRRRADGGEVESEIPVMLSDGEFVVPPEMVAELGGGDIAMGHDVLDAWIMDERQKAIQTLSELPPPATD